MSSETCIATVLEYDDMAKKVSDKPKPKQGIILVYKADEQMVEPFKEWLAGLADHVGAPVTVTIDMALKAYAVSHKYKPMPKRLAR